MTIPDGELISDAEWVQAEKTGMRAAWGRERRKVMEMYSLDFLVEVTADSYTEGFRTALKCLEAAQPTKDAMAGAMRYRLTRAQRGQ